MSSTASSASSQRVGLLDLPECIHEGIYTHLLPLRVVFQHGMYGAEKDLSEEDGFLGPGEDSSMGNEFVGSDENQVLQAVRQAQSSRPFRGPRGPQPTFNVTDSRSPHGFHGPTFPACRFGLIGVSSPMPLLLTCKTVARHVQEAARNKEEGYLRIIRKSFIEGKFTPPFSRRFLEICEDGRLELGDTVGEALWIARLPTMIGASVRSLVLAPGNVLVRKNQQSDIGAWTLSIVGHDLKSLYGDVFEESLPALKEVAIYVPSIATCSRHKPEERYDYYCWNALRFMCFWLETGKIDILRLKFATAKVIDVLRSDALTFAQLDGNHPDYEYWETLDYWAYNPQTDMYHDRWGVYSDRPGRFNHCMEESCEDPIEKKMLYETSFPLTVSDPSINTVIRLTRKEESLSALSTRTPSLVEDTSSEQDDTSSKGDEASFEGDDALFEGDD